MRRRLFLLSLPSGLLLAEGDQQTLRGTLAAGSGGKPELRMKDGKTVELDGDKDTVGVIRDARVIGSDFEVVGHQEEPGRFRIDPIHKRAMFVHKGEKRLFVTYWCEVCAIRTYTPGTCWCCQAETELDLRERIS